MSRTYYKVVDAYLYSARTKNDGWETKYKIGEFVSPPFGKSFIFRTLKAAKEFRSFFCREKIFRVEAKRVSKYGAFVRPCFDFEENALSKWNIFYTIKRRIVKPKNICYFMEYGLPD